MTIIDTADKVEEIFTCGKVITTENYTLRPIGMQDLQGLFDIFSDEEVVYWTDFNVMQNLDDAKEVAQMFMDGVKDRWQFRWAICQKGTENIIGTIGFFNIDTDSRRCEIGYDLNRKFHRKGIMKECAIAVLDLLFSELGFHRVEAVITPGNPASAGLLLKLGFTEEGTMREMEFYRGQYWDGTYFGLLDREWAAKK